MSLILASTSPIRRKLLAQAGLSFSVMAPPVDEEKLKAGATGLAPGALAQMRKVALRSTLTGEARKAAKAFGALAWQIVERGRPLMRPCCIIAGGELTVTVKGAGTGGRAQEFALAAAREIAGLRDVWIVGVGTDGTDGPTDAAGAVVDSDTWRRAAARGLNPGRALIRNDAYPLLKRLGHLIHTGPTGTNVNDLYLLLVL